jgi:hypothetical protein
MAKDRGCSLCHLVIGAAYFEASDISLLEFSRCLTAKYRAFKQSQPFSRDCDAEYYWETLKAIRVILASERRWSIAIASFVPVLCGWLLAYMFVGIGRWIKRGFNT